MPHPIEFDEDAEEQFRSLAPNFRAEIVFQLHLLAEDPVRLARRTPTPPYPPGLWYIVFESSSEGCNISILFDIEDGGLILLRGFGFVWYRPPGLD